jgi:hypothetical protein
VQTAFYRALEDAARALGHGAASAARAARAATVLDGHVARTRTAATWACRSGCAHCCRHPVGVTLAEVLRLQGAIDALPLDVQTALRARVAADADSTRGLAWPRLAGLRCPLLQGERCSVYGSRPLACRAWGSADAAACAQHLAGKAVPLPFDEAAFAAGLGVAAALDGGGGHRELRSALAAVLAVPPAGAAAAFAGARPAGT